MNEYPSPHSESSKNHALDPYATAVNPAEISTHTPPDDRRQPDSPRAQQDIHFQPEISRPDSSTNPPSGITPDQAHTMAAATTAGEHYNPHVPPTSMADSTVRLSSKVTGFKVAALIKKKLRSRKPPKSTTSMTSPRVVRQRPPRNSTPQLDSSDKIFTNDSEHVPPSMHRNSTPQLDSSDKIFTDNSEHAPPLMCKRRMGRAKPSPPTGQGSSAATDSGLNRHDEYHQLAPPLELRRQLIFPPTSSMADSQVLERPPPEISSHQLSDESQPFVVPDFHAVDKVIEALFQKWTYLDSVPSVAIGETEL